MMKKLIVAALILLLSVASYSQLNTKNISFELRYPVPVGNNFINKGYGKGYTGIIDLGLDYNLLNINGLGVGFLFNSTFLKLSKTDVDLLILSPKIKVDYEIDLNKVSIIPQIGIGYSNWRFNASDVTYVDENGDPYQYGSKTYSNGLTVKGATKFVINNDKKLKWYFNLSYEFTKLEKSEEDGVNITYNRNVQIIYPGIGMIWNFGE